MSVKSRMRRAMRSPFSLAVLTFLAGCDRPATPVSPANPPPVSSTPAPAAVEPSVQAPPAVPAPPMADPHKEAKEVIERLFAQYSRKPNSPPSVPLVSPPGTSAIKTSDSGEIIGVDLAHTPTTDADLEKVASIPSIEILMINSTNVTDAGIAHLKKLPNLKRLTLYGTAVSDAAIVYLRELKSLTFLGINATNVTKEGMDALREALPGCQVQ